MNVAPKRSLTKILIGIFLSGLSVGLLATPYMGIATTAYLFICAAIYYRRQTHYHVPLVLTGILIDLTLVLTLEIQRHAVETVIEGKLEPLQKAHILFSTLALILYFPTIYCGTKLYRNRGSSLLKRAHRILGHTAFIFRTIGFVLMFTLLAKIKSDLH